MNIIYGLFLIVGIALLFIAFISLVQLDFVGTLLHTLFAILMIVAGSKMLSNDSKNQPVYETKQETVAYKLTDVEIIKNKTKETNVDISKYNLLVVSGESSTIKEFETAYTGGTFILENGVRVEIEEVRHSSKITEPEFKATYTYDELIDNKGVKDAPNIKNETYSKGALILPMNIEAIENEAQQKE